MNEEMRYRTNTPDSICNYCGAKIGLSMKCPKCGVIDPPVHQPRNPMNEEIEKITKGYRDMILGDFKTVEEQQEWIRQRLEQAYLQGAKDAIEAIDSGLIDGLRERTVKNNIFPSYSEAQVIAFNKAQQFIDSLEGCHHSSLGSASTLVGGRCKVCGKATKEMDDLINGY